MGQLFLSKLKHMIIVIVVIMIVAVVGVIVLRTATFNRIPLIMEILSY